MKKVLAIVLAAVMVIGLAACGTTPAANNNTAPAANNAANNAAPAANNAANNAAPAGNNAANNAAPAGNNANNAAPAEAGPTVATVSPNGQKYSWVPTHLFFKEDAEFVFRDYVQVELLHKLQTKDGAICMSLDDMYRLYAPDFKVTTDGDKITVEHATVKAEATIGSKSITTYKGAAEMSVAPYKDGKTIYMPIYDFLCNGFGKVSSEATKITKFYCVSDTEEGKITRNDTYQLERGYRGQNYGLCQFGYWFEAAERVEPVVVYVPWTYDEAKPQKLIVFLHGAGGNCVGNGTGERGVQVAEAAERYGYMVAFVNGYCVSCNFGQIVQPAGLFPVTDKTDPKNPAGYSEGQLKDIDLSDKDVHAGIDFVKDHYNVDDKNMFIMGISMGGCGTWYQVAANPGMFNACSPAGAFVEPEFFDWSKVTTPTLYIGGTEDRNDFNLMVRAYKMAMEQGANIVKFEVVGGAPHGGEFPQRLDMIMEFFDSYLK